MGSGQVEVVGIHGLNGVQGACARLVVQIPEAGAADGLGGRMAPGRALVVGEGGSGALGGSVAHGPGHGMGAHEALGSGEHGALGAGGGVEGPLGRALGPHGAFEHALGHGEAEGVVDGSGVQAAHGLQHAVAAAQHRGGGVVGGHGLAALGRQHKLVQLGFDNGVHLMGILGREAFHAGAAQGVHLAYDEWMHRAVQQVVAHIAQRVGASDGALLRRQLAHSALQGHEEFRRARPMQGRGQLSHAAVARIGRDEEQRIGALVAQKEGLGRIAGAPDGIEGLAVHVFPEQVVRDDGRHGFSSPMALPDVECKAIMIGTQAIINNGAAASGRWVSSVGKPTY